LGVHKKNNDKITERGMGGKKTFHVREILINENGVIFCIFKKITFIQINFMTN